MWPIATSYLFDRRENGIILFSFPLCVSGTLIYILYFHSPDLGLPAIFVVKEKEKAVFAKLTRQYVYLLLNSDIPFSKRHTIGYIDD